MSVGDEVWKGIAQYVSQWGNDQKPENIQIGVERENNGAAFERFCTVIG
jgi:hypothetical protein